MHVSFRLGTGLNVLQNVRLALALPPLLRLFRCLQKTARKLYNSCMYRYKAHLELLEKSKARFAIKEMYKDVESLPGQVEPSNYF